MYYKNKGHPIVRHDHVFDFMLLILLAVGGMMSILIIGSELLKIIWNISETLKITIFMINKKIDLNI